MKDLIKNISLLFAGQLAKLFDKLRLSSPLAYVIVSAVVVTAGEIIRANPEFLSSAPEWVDYVIILVEILTPILLSSRTKRYMPNVEKLSEAQLNVLSVGQVKILQDYDD